MLEKQSHSHQWSQTTREKVLASEHPDVAQVASEQGILQGIPMSLRRVSYCSPSVTGSSGLVYRASTRKPGR